MAELFDCEMAFVKNQSYNRQSRNFPGVSVFSPIQLQLQHGKMLTILFAFSFCQPPRCFQSLCCRVLLDRTTKTSRAPAWASHLVGLIPKAFPPSISLCIDTSLAASVVFAIALRESLIRRMVSLVLCLSLAAPLHTLRTTCSIGL